MAGSSGEGLGIGIDLGTTYSCVGVLRNNNVEIIINDQGKRTTPSCVAYTESEHYVGNAATNQAPRNPLNTIYGAKRLIGRRFDDKFVQSYMKQCSFRIMSDQNSSPIMVVNYKHKEKRVTPEEVSSMVLSKMRSISESFIGKPIKGAVVTVPAYFNDSQRSSTKLAAEIAGLNVLGIINEPTAAAIAYGFERIVGNDNGHKTVLVFDLGGGTLDVSIVVIRKGVLEVKATCGDTYLGGEDFDTNMVNHFVEQFQMKHKTDISGSPKALRRLRTACESAKRILSSCHDTEVVVDSIFGGIDFNSTITRAKFEQLNSVLFEKCMEPVEKCLVDAHMKESDIDDVVMVGGSSRIPRIQELVRELFKNKNLCFTINPDEAIAHGAAIHASNLLNGDNNYLLNANNYVPIGANDYVKNFVLLDVIPLSIGVETCGNQMTFVIPRNTTIPVTKNHTVTTYYDNQVKAGIRVYEGEHELTIYNNFLGEFELTGIPRAKAGVPEIVLTFGIDLNGIVTVSAVETSVMRRKEITISSNRGRLSKEDVERMVREAEQYREENEKRRRRAEARSGLESLLRDVKDKLDDHSFSSRISSSNTKRIRNAIDQAEEYLEGGGGNDGDGYRFESLNLVLSSIWSDIKDDM